MKKKVCAMNPICSEYSLCGTAYDAPSTEEDFDPFILDDTGKRRVTCPDCLNIIKYINETYTKSGYPKNAGS